MTLGDRCDEIVRLIDETLQSVAADNRSGPGAEIDTSRHPSGAALLGRDGPAVAPVRRSSPRPRPTLLQR